MTDTLAQLIDRLEHAAADLRSDRLSAEKAAGLVEDCARLAGEAASELDRRVRAVGGAEPLPELARQLSLSS